MGPPATAARPVHYVEVDEDLCNGCVLCMKACPMKAIRVRDGVARIEGVCIDCMECARVCPRGAIRGVSVADVELEDHLEKVVCPTTVPLLPVRGGVPAERYPPRAPEDGVSLSL